MTATAAEGPEEIFRTVHGSHLYGLAHPGSDMDMFIVTTSARRKARQSVVGDADIMRVGWGVFLERAFTGSHQSVEALFSPFQDWNPAYLHLRPMLSSMRVCGGDVLAKYERTIRAFAHGDFKRRRHAARLAIGLAGLRNEGRFNPVLRPDEVVWVTELASLGGDELLAVLIP